MQNLRDSGNFEFFESLAAEITEAIKHKVKPTLKNYNRSIRLAYISKHPAIPDEPPLL